MSRLDRALVELGLAPTRSKAQQLIEAGDVEIFIRDEWITASQPSQSVRVSLEGIRLRPETPILRYVSRGGLKLESALQHLQLNVRGFRCVDVGISTGGFSDALLKAGAIEICGIDVGHGQLHPSLLENTAVRSFEGVHVKDMEDHSEIRSWIAKGVDLCVVDLSFISLNTLAGVLARILPGGTRLLALVKPQFELGAQALDKKGIVKDPSLYQGLEQKTRSEFSAAGFEIRDYFPCPIKGQDGNQEFFLSAVRSR